MSEKIKEKLLESFTTLQQDLSRQEYKNLINAAIQEIDDDDEGYYKYVIPLLDGTGILKFEYYDSDFYGENSFDFTLEKAVPLHFGIYCHDVQEKMDNCLEDADLDCQYSYREDDEKGYLTVSTSLAKSWKRPSAQKHEEMVECVQDCFRAMAEYEKLVSEEAKKPNFYDSVRTILSSAIDKLAPELPDYTTTNIDISIYGEDLDSLGILAELEGKNSIDELTFGWAVEGELIFMSTQKRHGLPKKKCEALAKAFLENDEIELFDMDGRGEESTFTFIKRLACMREDLNARTADRIVREIININKKTAEFSNLLEQGDTVQISDIKPVPDVYLPFLEFGRKVLQELEKGTIPGLAPMPQQNPCLRWGDDNTTVDFSIFFEQPIFQLVLQFYTGGALRLVFFAYRFGLSAATATEIWDEQDFENKTENLDYKERNFGRGINGYFKSTYYPPSNFNDLEALQELDLPKTLDFLREFFQIISSYCLLLKQKSNLSESDYAQALQNLIASQKSYGACEQESSSKNTETESREDEQKGNAQAPDANAGDTGILAIPENLNGAQTQKTTPFAENTQTHIPNNDKDKKPDSKILEKFQRQAENLFNIIKRDSAFGPLLTNSLPEADINSEKLTILLPIEQSPLNLRIRYHVQDKILELGWFIPFDPKFIDLYQFASRKIKKRTDGLTHVDAAKHNFAVFWEKENESGVPEEQLLSRLWHKVANFHGDVMKLKKREESFIF